MMHQRGGKQFLVLSAAAAMTPIPACLATEMLRLECHWSAHFDTSTNQVSPAAGSASYTIDIRESEKIEIRRADLATPLTGRANHEQLSATAQYTIDGVSIQEFVAIHRLTGAIEAWTMMGEAGGAFTGRCSSVPD